MSSNPLSAFFSMQLNPVSESRKIKSHEAPGTLLKPRAIILLPLKVQLGGWQEATLFQIQLISLGRGDEELNREGQPRTACSQGDRKALIRIGFPIGQQYLLAIFIDSSFVPEWT
jgi:hypothetical protein